MVQDMLDNEQIQGQLHALLPPEFHDRIPDLVRLLREASAQPEGNVESFATDTSLRPLLEQLSGRQIHSGQSQISFGADNHFNTITIGDVAGGNIITLNVSFKEGPRTTQRLRWILVGIVVIVVLVGGVLFQINAVNARRADQARQTISTDVLDNLTNLNARLTFVDVTLKELPGPNVASSVYELISTQQIASLRQALAGKMLATHPDESLLQLVTETTAQPDQIRRFYTNLSEVQDDTESLITTLSSLARVKNGDTALRNHYLRQLDLEHRLLQTSSRITYLWGLIALDNLKTQPDDVASQLGSLQHFEPHQLQPTTQLLQAMAPLVDQLAQLVDERKAMLGDAQQGLDDALVIKSDDPWNVVVGKAIATRKSGDIERAVAAFQRYGEMFAASDPTSAQYSQVAQSFTRQVEVLGIESAMYIYQVEPGSSAQQAGIQVGDIVVDLDGTATPNANAFELAVRQLVQGRNVTLVVLRLQPDGNFARLTPTASTTPLGISAMPI